MKYLPLMKKHGVKLTHVADKIGISESLLRYHLAQNPIDPDVEKKLVRTLRSNAESLVKALN